MARHHEPFKELFSIHDLENLTGIKAHTIRMWEKRFALLHPSRDAHNVRHYSPADLRKMLNVAALTQYGYRISAIACLPEEELNRLVARETTGHESLPGALGELKLAMMTFDQGAFDRTFAALLTRYSFREVFTEFFLPLLRDIGLLWQTGTIHIGHEHFISNLIRQKILLQIERLDPPTLTADKAAFVLFLPPNEVHELGLLYLHYTLRSAGAFTVYLGPSVPDEVLLAMTRQFSSIEFVAWLTVEPHAGGIPDYVEKLAGEVLRPGQDRLWLLGRRAESYTPTSAMPHVRVIHRPDDLLAFFC